MCQCQCVKLHSSLYASPKDSDQAEVCRSGVTLQYLDLIFTVGLDAEIE